MQAKQMQVIKAIGNAMSFLNEFAQYLPRTHAAGARQQLDVLASRFHVDAAIQAGETQAYHDAALRGEALRKALFVCHLAPLVAAARVIGGPSLSRITLPRSTASYADLVAAAFDLAEQAKLFQAPLVAVGLAPDFVEQLEMAVVTVAQSAATTSRHLAARAAATRRLACHARSARQNLRVVDRLVRSELGARRRMMAGWNRVSRASG